MGPHQRPCASSLQELEALMSTAEKLLSTTYSKTLAVIRSVPAKQIEDDRALVTYLRSLQFRVQLVYKWQGSSKVAKLFNVFCMEAQVIM